MTLSELKAISAACQTDEEFLAHPEVRRVYWQVVEPGKVCKHIWNRVSGHCVKCEKRASEVSWRDNGNWKGPCEISDPVFIPFTDAVEAMRAKVAEKWEQTVLLKPWEDFRAALAEVSHFLEWDNRYVLDTPRDHFLIFTAAAGAVEAE